MIEKGPGLYFLFYTVSFNDNSNTVISPVGFLYNSFKQNSRDKWCCDYNGCIEISLYGKGYTW